MNRRKFMGKTALGTAAALSSVYIPSYAANKKLRLGLIGSGWYGMVLMKAALKDGNVEVVGICDVDTEHLEASSKELMELQGKAPKKFTDYQELLDQKNLDAIFIGTQPHWHALQFIDATSKGFPIYCEKPLAYDIREGQAMIKAQEAAGNIVQIGFQRRQSKAFQKVKEMIRVGELGKVHQVKAQIHYGANLKDHTVQEPPASLNWEAWCGPAPKLQYRPIIGHMAWRLEKEYGNGHLVDWGIHHIDTIRFIMDEEMPTEYHAMGGIYEFEDKITTPDTLAAQFAFEKAPVMWEHRIWGAAEYEPSTKNGIFFYGDKATVFASDHRLVVIPNEEDAQPKEIEMRTKDMQERHVHEFLNAVRENKQSMVSCTIQDAAKSTAAVQLAMVAYEAGSRIKWDQSKMEVVNNPEAAKMVMRPYRGDYKHPYQT